MFYLLIVFIHVYWSPTRFSYQMVFTVTRRVTLPEHTSSPSIVSGVRVARSFSFCVVFCRSLFVLLAIISVFSNFTCKYYINGYIFFAVPFFRREKETSS
jgi:hypothetical protein